MAHLDAGLRRLPLARRQRHGRQRQPDHAQLRRRARLRSSDQPGPAAGLLGRRQRGKCLGADLSTSGQITGGHLGVYGVKTWGAAYAAAAVSYARLDNSTTRAIVGVGPSEPRSGNLAAISSAPGSSSAGSARSRQFTLTPFVAIEPAALWAQRLHREQRDRRRRAGILGLSFASRTTTSLPTFVGIQTDTRTVLATARC